MAPRNCDTILAAYLIEDLLVALAEKRLPSPPPLPRSTTDTVRPPAREAV